jgi:hypothetical protein
LYGAVLRKPPLFKRHTPAVSRIVSAFTLLAKPMSGGICHKFLFANDLGYDLALRLKMREGEK